MFIERVTVMDLPEEAYFAQIPALKSLEQLTFDRPITFFMGENGSGKSTLLEAIAVQMGFNPEGGSINFNFSTRDTHASLDRHIRISKGYERPKDSFFLRGESYYNVSSYLEEIYRGEKGRQLMEKAYGGAPHERSHGQAFLNLITQRFRGQGLYILDEPEAALSPQNQLAAMVKLYELAQSGSQFLIATHSPILSRLPNARIYEFSDQIKQVNYQETQSYRITQLLMEQPEQLLHHLFRGEWDKNR